MATLIEAVMAHKLVLLDGVRTLRDSIKDREEFVVAIPSTFPAVIGFLARGNPNEKFKVSSDVLSYQEKPIWSSSDQMELSAEGKLEGYAKVDIPALDVGPCYVLLKFDDTEVWRQRIFFALA
jgi:hypothetical protein